MAAHKSRKSKIAALSAGALLAPWLNQLDIKTPWVLRLLAVISILILSMLVL